MHDRPVDAMLVTLLLLLILFVNTWVVRGTVTCAKEHKAMSQPLKPKPLFQDLEAIRFIKEGTATLANSINNNYLSITFT